MAGAHLYSVYLDGQPIAILEDRQSQVTFIHTDKVNSGSQVVVVPLTYGDMREGTHSHPVNCL